MTDPRQDRDAPEQDAPRIAEDPEDPRKIRVPAEPIPQRPGE